MRGIMNTSHFKHKGRLCEAEKVEIFYLERELAVKRRSHYA